MLFQMMGLKLLVQWLKLAWAALLDKKKSYVSELCTLVSKQNKLSVNFITLFVTYILNNNLRRLSVILFYWCPAIGYIIMNEFFFPNMWLTGFVSFFSLWLYVLQRMEGDEDESQRVKLSKQNGVRKSESEEERREMITPALRDALTKQGTAWP